MKEVKSFNYKGYEVSIQAEFSYNDWKNCDYIFLVVKMTNGEEIIKEYFSAYEEKPVRFLFWTIKKGKTLKQATEEEIEDICVWTRKVIDNKVYRKKMTDGLMDSLDALD